MQLWTIQHHKAYENLMEKGRLTADPNYLFCGKELLFAYDWMAETMKRKGVKPPPKINYPLWAWAQWEGKRKKQDLRKNGYGQSGTKMVQLTIEIDESNLLLSDFDLFHYVLNFWDALRSKIQKSWDRIFDLEREDDGTIYGKKESKSIQATFWELHKEQVVRADNFVAG